MRTPLGYIHPKSLKNLSEHLRNLVQNRLWLKILIGMFLGVVVGLLANPSTGLVGEELGMTIGNWLALPGNIFLGMIQMIVIPLVFASIITGLASTDSMDHLKKIGGRAVFYFVITTVIAIIIGISITLIVQPGQYIDSSGLITQQETVSVAIDDAEGEINSVPGIEDVPSLISNIIPENPLGAMVEREMLQVVLFAVIIGIALITLAPEQSKPLLSLLNSIQEVSMTVVKWAMLIAPVAVFGLLAQTTITTGLDAIMGMLIYVITVLGGFVMLIGVYAIMVKLFSNSSPLGFFKAIREVQLLAFSTSSSAAVMPLSIETAEDKLNVKSATAQFVIPLGATINMNGTALYQGAATIFLSQVYNIELGIGALILVVITTVAASIGTPSTPGVGIIILAMILTSVGIPTSGIALILGVDRILDMTRTSVNVTGDLTACLVLEKWLK